MNIIAATAIEDKLQDDVGDTIAALKKAGIFYILKKRHQIMSFNWG